MYIGQLKEGDYVIAYSRWGRNTQLAKVTRTTKTQLVVQTEPMNDEKGFVSREVRITKRSGKQVGTDKWWSHCEDVEAIKARWEKAKAANPELAIQELPHGIKMTTFKDGDGREVLLFFTVQTREDDVYFPFGMDEMQYRVEAATYGPYGIGDDGWNRHSPEYGKTVEAALLDLIAPTFPY